MYMLLLRACVYNFCDCVRSGSAGCNLVCLQCLHQTKLMHSAANMLAKALKKLTCIFSSFNCKHILHHTSVSHCCWHFLCKPPEMPSKLPSEEILTDLVARFIFNVPDFERNTFERLMFLVEQAHWHYEDCIVDRNPELKSLSIKEFTALMFEKTPGLEEYKEMCADILRDWQAYKSIVPVYGAILLDPSLTHCLMVRGYKANAGWGFPRGKVAKDEEGPACAIREVKEETGLDISSLIIENEFIEVISNNQSCRLYIIPGIDRSTCFAPLVKKEIGGFAWHSVDELPMDKDEANQVFLTESGERHKFFMVWPFVKQLRKWIAKQRRGPQITNASSRAAAAVLPSSTALQDTASTPSKGLKHSKSAGKIKNTNMAASSAQSTAHSTAALLGIGESRNAATTVATTSHTAAGAAVLGTSVQHGLSQAASVDIKKVLPGYTPFTPVYPEAWKSFRFDTAAVMARVSSVR